VENKTLSFLVHVGLIQTPPGSDSTDGQLHTTLFHQNGSTEKIYTHTHIYI